ncbi:hypothetical protein T265_07122 [Opisthorchis viverrini]|uniref:GSKIP domain-containing protein n=1 Tax=Opisthorchis viverrini TaxID=6198 RepID=A0A074ZDS8_OPIVI|nr:hypothetical protein T265_07122 [Opisthorchis viverrini]KER25441.1 hypothetical protein T265_07122 [Opisthorchis viverrini]
MYPAPEAALVGTCVAYAEPSFAEESAVFHAHLDTCLPAPYVIPSNLVTFDPSTLDDMDPPIVSDGFSELNRSPVDDDNKLCSVEAEAAIKEVAFGVKQIARASDSLPYTDSLAYLNVTTLEDKKMCIEISARGFCPVGEEYDKVKDDAQESEYYETIYALLSARSTLFQYNGSVPFCESFFSGIRRWSGSAPNTTD